MSSQRTPSPPITSYFRNPRTYSYHGNESCFHASTARRPASETSTTTIQPWYRTKIWGTTAADLPRRSTTQGSTRPSAPAHKSRLRRESSSITFRERLHSTWTGRYVSGGANEGVCKGKMRDYWAVRGEIQHEKESKADWRLERVFEESEKEGDQELNQKQQQQPPPPKPGCESTSNAKRECRCADDEKSESGSNHSHHVTTAATSDDEDNESRPYSSQLAPRTEDCEGGCCESVGRD